MRLDEIRLYPVKGLRGFSVAEAVVEPWGLEHDRRWMVVDPSGRFVTQRQIPVMAVIAAELIPGGLRLSAEGEGARDVPLPGADAPLVSVTVWDDTVVARAARDADSHWLSQALGQPVRLVHMADPDGARACDPDYAAKGDVVSFADGFPLLATTTGSLDDLNGRLASPVTMDRFRPNIVIGGAPAWAEDRWTRLRVGAVEFAAVKDCARCVVTTVDQATGIKSHDNEPLKTLAAFRRKAAGRIIFGQNMVPRAVPTGRHHALGRIAVGDPVDPLS